MNPTGQPFSPQPGADPTGGARDQLNMVAIVLMVVAAVASLFSLTSLVSSLVGGDGSWALNFVQDDELKEKLREAMEQQGSAATKAISVLQALIALAANGVVILGALKMRALQSYPLAMASAIISCIPCCFSSCCCIVGMPAGIYAVILLMKPEVKAAFS